MASESVAKSLLKKERFFEWLSLRNDLTGEDWRLAVVLTSLSNEKDGFAWPSIETLAKILRRDKKSIRQSIARLEERGVFEVRRHKNPGRSMVNRYYPRFDQVPDGSIYELGKGGIMTPPFVDADGADERGAFTAVSEAERGASEPKKGGITVPPDPRNTISEEDIIRSVATASPVGDAYPLPSVLKKLERWIASKRDCQLSTDECVEAKLWHHWLDGIAQKFDEQDGDPLGDWAGRLRDQIDMLFNRSEGA